MTGKVDYDAIAAKFQEQERQERIESARKRAELLDRRADARAHHESTYEPLDTVDYSLGQFGSDALVSPLSSPLWGSTPDVLWAVDQSLIIAGSSGAGKTTVALQIVAAMITGGGYVLGHYVRGLADNERVLYLGLDRPEQIKAAFRRLGIDAEDLDRHLILWTEKVDLIADRTGMTLVRMCEELGDRAGGKIVAAVVDSLKDVTPSGLASPSVAKRWGTVVRNAIAAGVQIMALHHVLKFTGDTAGTLESLAGSKAITDDAGSVLALVGPPGGICTLHHAKQALSTVGPLRILHDGVTGISAVIGSTEPLDVLREAGKDGATAAGVALCAYGSANRASIERARRALDALVTDGEATVERGDAKAGGAGGNSPSKYFPVPNA